MHFRPFRTYFQTSTNPELHKCYYFNFLDQSAEMKGTTPAATITTSRRSSSVVVGITLGTVLPALVIVHIIIIVLIYSKGRRRCRTTNIIRDDTLVEVIPSTEATVPQY